MTAGYESTQSLSKNSLLPCPETDRSSRFHDLLVAALPSLRRQALALMGHRADAEDLVHATVISALAAQESFEIGTNFHAWMSCILRNRYLSGVRRRRPTVALDDAPMAQLTRSGGQEENLAVQEVKGFLLRLPADQCEILMMISVQGLSYEEASAQLGIAIGTLKYRVFRARSQLQLWTVGRGPVKRGGAPAEKAANQP